LSRLTKGAIVQIAESLAFFALIFISAGTLRYWPGWLFCLTVSISTITTGFYIMRRDPPLLERRMRFGPAAESRLIQKVTVTITLIWLVALAILPALDHRFGWSHVSPAIVVIANLLIMVAFGIFLLVLRENTFAASTVTVEPGQRVISTGPYALVRHPMYAGGLLAVVAMPLALGSLWGLLLSVIPIVLLIIRVYDEENALSAELPGYTNYRAQVRYRLIPLLR
jgi:protein-S-isoprenylcysteine O-methyltransferase Ste14